MNSIFNQDGSFNVNVYNECIKWPCDHVTVDITEWCQANCQGRWTNILYYWHFEELDDYLLFKLTWK